MFNYLLETMLLFFKQKELFQNLNKKNSQKKFNKVLPFQFKIGALDYSKMPYSGR